MPSYHDDSPAETNFDRPLLSVRTAREAAFVAIEEYLEAGTWVNEVLDRTFRTASLPPIERGLATELACGVVRRLATLDAILSRLVARPLEKVEPPLLTILRLGIYQLALLDGVPPHAALHETVELTKRLGRHQWSGFVNGVLRGGTRFITADCDTKPSSRGVPLAGDRFRRLVEPVFPDPRCHPTGYFAEAFSFPQWLAERWATRMSPTELFRLGAWFNSAGRLTLRANRLRTSSKTLLQELTQAGIAAQAVAETGSLVLEESRAVEKLPGFDAGWFAVQDVSASRAAERLAPQAGWRVWDVCAAPGGKTCHLAELMDNRGEIIATDIRPDRLGIIEENRRRLGADIIRTQLIGEDGSSLPEGPFDAILVDVPCSNTGVLGKRPEARWRITPTGIFELNRVQERLLISALERLALHGRLAYSTCSIEPEENGDLVRRVLSRRTDVMLVEEQLFLPGQPTDGGYQALLVRAG